MISDQTESPRPSPTMVSSVPCARLTALGLCDLGKAEALVGSEPLGVHLPEHGHGRVRLVVDVHRQRSWFSARRRAISRRDS